MQKDKEKGDHATTFMLRLVVLLLAFASAAVASDWSRANNCMHLGPSVDGEGSLLCDLQQSMGEQAREHVARELWAADLATDFTVALVVIEKHELTAKDLAGHVRSELAGVGRRPCVVVVVDLSRRLASTVRSLDGMVPVSAMQAVMEAAPRFLSVLPRDKALESLARLLAAELIAGK